MRLSEQPTGILKLSAKYAKEELLLLWLWEDSKWRMRRKRTPNLHSYRAAHYAPFLLRILTPRRSKQPRTAPTPVLKCLAMVKRDLPETYIASASSP